ncbi:MAG: HAMP domain-containing histidine kinase [Nitrosomonas sp.]|nr:HAMP domain-containing histidine kinase [Nitrosomonas sp.]
MGADTDIAGFTIKTNNTHTAKIQRYPNSFLKLILFGFSLVGIPLIVVLINSAITIDRLAEQSRETVYQATQVTHGSRVLSDEVLAMERSLRQAFILGDASLFEGYFHSHARFEETTEALMKLSLLTEERSVLEKIRLSERGIHDEIIAAQDISEHLHAHIESFSDLLESVKHFIGLGNLFIDREVNKTREMASQARINVEVQLLILIPFVMLLAVAFSVLITRPIRQIDEAIYSMGQGELSKSINVEGPQNLQYLGERLDWMRRRLLKLEKQKIQFLRHVSHELKTPLTAIREGADLLAEGVTGRLTKQQQLIADILHSSSLQLQKRIEDLLSYSAIQIEKTALVKQPVNLSEILDETIQNQNLSIMSKELKINRNYPDFLFECDKEKIETIIDNLLSNAVKFSPSQGCIDINIIEKNEFIQLDIIDSGVGIHDSDKLKIFEPFYQGQFIPETHVRGTGLGLSIAKEFALAHGGSLTLIDQKGVGAHFRLILPVSDIEKTL